MITDTVEVYPLVGNGPISGSGDSGGVVYSNTGTTYGIVTGSISTGGKHGLAYSKAGNFHTTFGVARY